MPGVNSTLFENIWEKILQQTFPVWKLCPLFVKSNKTKNPNCRTVTPNNYYTFSPSFLKKDFIFYIFYWNAELFSDNGRAGQFHHYETSSMGRHQVVLTGGCQDQNIFYRPNNIMKYFLKKLNDLSRVSIAGAWLCWQ